MRSLMKYFTVLMLVTCAGCSQSSDNTSMEAASEEAVAPVTDQKTDAAVERKLIKEGQVEFETSNLSSTRKTIFEAVDKYKGYVSSDHEFKSDERHSNTLTIRVPAENFDNLLKDATDGVDRFDSKEINVKDVTEEFLDIEARVKTKKELEARYLEILKKAKNVTEMLEIEKQSGELRAEIESIEGRLKYLQNNVSFSTLTMSVYVGIPDQNGFSEKFKSGFINGWNNLIWFFVALINIWPFILIVVGLLIGIRIYRNKR